jgi:hypothetical protein
MARKATALMLPVVLLALLSGGCGGSDNESSSDGPTAQPTTRQQQTKTVKPAGGYSGALAKTYRAGRARCAEGVDAAARELGLPPASGFDAVAARYAQRFSLAGGYRDAAYAGCLQGMIRREN